MVNVLLGGMLGMLECMDLVTVGEMSMMRRLVVVAGLRMLRSLMVVAGSVLEMLGSLFVVMMRGLVAHVSPLVICYWKKSRLRLGANGDRFVKLGLRANLGLPMRQNVCFRP